MNPGTRKLAIDFVAAQLRAAVSPSVDWSITGIDRAQELAGLFVARGVLDLEQLSIERLDPRESLIYAFGTDLRGFEPTREITVYTPDGRDFPGTFVGRTENEIVSVVNEPYSWDEYVKEQGHVPYVFVYEGRRIGYLGDINRNGSYSNEYKLFQWSNTLNVPFVAWSSQGDGNVTYCILTGPNGFGVVPFWASSSAGDKAFFVESLQMGFAFASFALAMAGSASIVKQLGTKILGPELAAAYPSVANAVGQTAIGTVFNGGDVEQAAIAAVKSAGASSVGAFAGAQAADLTGVDAVGRVASAATTAYIRGTSVDAAVGLALVSSIPDLGSGTSNANLSPTINAPIYSAEGSNVEIFDSNFTGGFQVPELGFGDTSAFVFDQPQGFSPVFLPGFIGTTYSDDGFSFGSPLTGGAADTQIDAFSGPSSWWDDTRRWFGDTFTKDNLQTAVQVTRGVADIVRTVRNIDSPAPAPVNARPGAPRIVANPNGTFTVTTPAGASQVVTAAQLQQMQAGSAGGFSITPGVAIAGAAALAAVLLLR